MRSRFQGHLSRPLFVFCTALLLCACASRDAQRIRPPAGPGEARLPAPAQPVQVAPYIAAPVPLPLEKPSTPIATPLATPLAGAPPVSSAGPHIALILPLGSKGFATVAEAFRQGFVAAAGFEGRNAPAYRIYAAENEGDALAGAFRNAVNNGAVLAIAGLTRDGATLLARMGYQGSPVPILALNAPDFTVPDHYFYVSLSLDNEARQAALFAAREGARSVAIVHSSSALTRRILEGFEKEWTRLGGAIAVRIPFAGDPNDAPRIRAKLENLSADIVFVAAEPEIARIARPYIPPGMPVYATSLSFDTRADAVSNIDLDGVRFLDMPWFVQPDHPAVMIYPRPSVGISVEQERLYALGVDAWRLAVLLLKGDTRNRVLDGVTGRLTLDDGRQFLRALTAVEFRDGRTQAYKNSAE